MIKCEQGQKGSGIEEFFCARILAEGVEGVMQARFDRAEWREGGQGDLCEGESINETEQQYFAVFLRQAGQDSVELSKIGGGAGWFGSGDLVQGGGVIALGAGGFALCCDRKVPHGRIEEGFEICGEAKSWEFSEHVQKGFLEHIEGRIV